MEPFINIEEYTYDLPPDRIARYPAEQRDASKLLVYDSGSIDHRAFKEITDLLPTGSLLVFNNTKVIPARMLFQKETGAEIELFLLNPIKPSPWVHEMMTATSPVQWNCAIGNLKRWNEQLPLTRTSGDITLLAKLIDRTTGTIEFSWNPPQTTFAEIVSLAGMTPLPPYIKRRAEASDAVRYQTIYSLEDGAVAAPTAGLHFTENILNEISHSGISIDFLTLHVSAGTFQPVKVSNALDHEMHAEQIIITEANLRNLLAQRKDIIAVGTTSLRTLESIYWYGVKLLSDPAAEFRIEKFEAYKDHAKLPDRRSSFQAVLDKMTRMNVPALAGETSIFILPGYQFKVIDGLITNFHQPGSTLLLLIAALVGEDWKNIYEEALESGYRFLSYGDSSYLRVKSQR